MGKQTNIRLRATVGNIIYYQWKGIDCIRTVPAKVRQTANTKKAASVFGVAAKSAAKLRAMLRPELPDPTDRTMMYALDNVFRKWLHTNPLKQEGIEDNLPWFALFSFNKKAVTGKMFSIVQIRRKGENDLLVTIPSFNPMKNITAPLNTASIGIRLKAVSLPLEDLSKAQAIEVNASFLYQNLEMAPQEIILAGLTGPKTLTTVIMALNFYRNENQSLPVKQMRWQPVAIIASFYN